MKKKCTRSPAYPLTTHTTRLLSATILVLALVSAVHAYPSVVIGTPYTDAPAVKTTVLYNPYSGNTYVYDNSNTRDAYADGYYDGKYNRNPSFCRYDWFDRCKFDPDRAYDYYYSRCHNYDPSDDEWYDRDCDLYFGRYRPGSYDGHYDYQYTNRYNNAYNYRYSNYYGYPQYHVYYMNTMDYGSTYYGGYY